ncbi:Uncharacterised protein [Bordetella pertussis]|nr:Uncharacterised protein [Bordetella pertussis]
MNVEPVHHATASHSTCLVALMRSLRALHGASSRRMRAMRSPSTRRSIHMKISV